MHRSGKVSVTAFELLTRDTAVSVVTVTGTSEYWLLGTGLGAEDPEMSPHTRGPASWDSEERE